MIALLFPGQGSETPGMGADWAQDPLVAYVGEQLGEDVPRLLRRGGRALARTSVLQPVLVALGLAAARELARSGLTWSVCGGHSLGEWTAWAAAGGIADQAVLDAVIARGQAMEAAALHSPGGMVLGRDGVAEAGLTVGIEGPHGTAWTGPEEAVQAAVSRGARRLAVSGAWHGSLMRDAREQLAPLVPDSAPLTAELVLAEGGDRVGAEAVRDALLDQLVHPARWSRVIQTVARCDVRAIVAVGPSRGLRHDLRRVGLPVYRLDDRRDLAVLCATLEPR